MMKKLLFVLVLLSLFGVSFSQTTQTSFVVSTIANMKSYFGYANRIHVATANQDYVICSPCTTDEVYIFAGAGGRKWMKVTDSTRLGKGDSSIYYPYVSNPKSFLTTIDTTNIANFSVKVRSLIIAQSVMDTSLLHNQLGQLFSGVATNTTNITTNTSNMNKKYDSTQWIIATTQESVLNSGSTGFVNFGNGGTLTYDGTNKRLSVAVTGVSQGVWFGPELISGHRYVVKVNVTTNGNPLLLAQRYAYGYTVLYDGDNYTAFTADAGTTGLLKKMVIMKGTSGSGTFYVNFMQIKEVPIINFPYTTLGDVYTELPNLRARTNVQIGLGSYTGYTGAGGVTGYQIAIGYNAIVNPLATSGIAIGINSLIQGTGGIPEGSILIGDSTIGQTGRQVIIGGHARADAVSSTTIGYGAYSKLAHALTFGRGAYNDLSASLNFGEHQNLNEFYFGSIAGKTFNPAMPGGGETYDFTASQIAGTQVSILRTNSGRDATASPSLTSIPGAIMRLSGGQSTGTANGGNLQLSVTKPGGSSNNTVNADFVALEISGVDGSTLIKKIKPSLTTTTSASTITINSDTTTFYTVTALAANLTIANPTGTPNAGQKLIIRIKDNGTSRTLTFGSEFRFSSDLTAPSATTISKTLYLEFIRNNTDTKWDMISKLDNF